MSKNWDAPWEEQSSTPSTPSSGKRKIYPKSDGWYDLDDAGNERGPLLAEEIVTATPSTPYAIDWATGTLFEITLGQNTTFTFSNLVAGRAITLVLIQDATGSRTVTWPASVDWPSATAPTLSTGANDVDVITLFVRADGSTVLGFVAGQDMG